MFGPWQHPNLAAEKKLEALARLRKSSRRGTITIAVVSMGLIAFVVIDLLFDMGWGYRPRDLVIGVAIPLVASLIYFVTFNMIRVAEWRIGNSGKNSATPRRRSSTEE